VYEERVLREISELENEEVAGGWRKLHIEGLYRLYASLCTIRVIKSREMRWTGHIARM
jgi:hypothetical protein